MIKKYLFLCLVLLAAVSTKAAPVTIIEQGGWFESGYVTWQKAAGMEYNVYVSPAASESWTKLDDELVREYPSYGRADALGLKAGSYKFKVVPVNDGEESAGDAAVSSAVEVKAHDRSGFAHKKAGTNGIGAYNNDGTLKSDARVVYVWADNAKTVSLDVVSGSNGKTTTYTGLQQIIYGYQKGDANGSYDKRPLCVRIIGTIKDSDMDTFLSSAEGIQIKGAKAYQPLNMTIEGVGNDATIYGFGFLIRNVAKVELRNFGIMLCMDDAVSIDTDNEMIWVHNLDIFYGKAGSDADQAKGDGTIDLKGDSRYMTISYNHLYDSGKASLCGMKSETGPNWITYHHNWFDHSDSRHPRIRTMSVHVWNNYFDGNSKYGVGAAYNSEAFVENNYFRNCKYPMLSSLQGSDVAGGGKGTFSGENGGVIKSFGNFIKNARAVVSYQQDQTEFDCWEAPTRNDQVPSSVQAKVGGKTYSNFDTDASIMYDYVPDAAEDVPAIVKGQYGAGRMQHGDFTWTFNNSVQDENYNVISELKSALQSYRSTLVGFFEGQQISNGGAVNTVDAGDGKGLTDEQQDYTPYWAGGGGGVVTAGLPDPRFCGPETESGSKIYDYLWFNAANATAINGYISNGWLTYSEGGSFNGTRELKSSDGTITSKYTGSMQIPQGGSVTFKCEKGFLSVAAAIFRTGSASGEIQLSKNGTSFSKIADYAASKGDATISASGNESKGPIYIRITNKASGSLHITGIKIMYPDPDGTPDTPEPEDPEDPDEPQLSDDATADFTIGGNPVSFVNYTATITLAFDDPTTSLNVSVTPAEGATISSVSGATGSAGSYTITAPEGGKSVTATFTITAENGKTKKNYAITVKRTAEGSAGGEDDDSNTDLVLYFKGSKPSNTTFYSITSPAYKTKYGSETYKGITSDVSLEPQSATKITFTTTKEAKLVIVYGTQGKNKDIKLDGEKTTATEIAIAAGQHTLEKASASVEIFFIDVIYGDGGGQPGGGDDPTPQPSTKTVFSTTATAALSVSALSSVEITSDNATTTGGKIYAINNFTNKDNPNGQAKDMIKVQNKIAAFQHTNNTTYFRIELDEALQAGDVISSKVYLRDDTKIGLWLLPSEERPEACTTAMVAAQASAAGWGKLPTYTITAGDGLAGATTFYIHRATDKSTCFTDFVITRPSATGIKNVNVNDNGNGNVYDLMGRRVTAPQTGKVYIKGGKKFIMR